MQLVEATRRINDDTEGVAYNYLMCVISDSGAMPSLFVGRLENATEGLTEIEGLLREVLSSEYDSLPYI